MDRRHHDGPEAGTITARGLTQHYGRILALDHLDLDVPAGSVFGFLGPNGAGKTTALRLLTGLARPTSGTAMVAGVEVGRDRLALASRIGYLDQQPRLFGWMRGAELLEFAGRLYGLDGRALRERVGNTLELVGLADAGLRRVSEYSGGMRQRLGIAQAILHRPAVVFLDEPVSALDPQGRKDVLEIVARLRMTSTVFMSTHILGDVERVCDRVAIIDRGRLIAEADIADLLERYAQPVYEVEPESPRGDDGARLAALLRGQPWTREVTVDGGAVRVLVSDPGAAGGAILPLVARAGIRLARFERVRPSLEDVFLQLVGREQTMTQEAA